MKKLFAILIMCSLSLPVLATKGQGVDFARYSEQTLETFTTEEVGELNKSSVPEPDLETIPKSLPSKYKQPLGKKKLAKKFIIAMLCVAGTSIFLYAALSLYNKIREGFGDSAIVPPEGEKPLDAPNDLTDAIKTFVEKTRWDK